MLVTPAGRSRCGECLRGRRPGSFPAADRRPRGGRGDSHERAARAQPEREFAAISPAGTAAAGAAGVQLRVRVISLIIPSPLPPSSSNTELKGGAATARLRVRPPTCRPGQHRHPARGPSSGSGRHRLGVNRPFQARHRPVWSPAPAARAKRGSRRCRPLPQPPARRQPAGERQPAGAGLR